MRELEMPPEPPVYGEPNFKQKFDAYLDYLEASVQQANAVSIELSKEQES